MKNVNIIISLISILIIVCSCSKSIDDNFNSMEKQKAEALLFIENKLIVMEDNQYSITISKEEALEYGISNDVYEIVLKEVVKANELINSIIKEAKTKSLNGDAIIVEDCTYDEIEIVGDFPVVKTNSEGETGNIGGGIGTGTNLPSGLIKTSGVGFEYNSCYAPSRMSSEYAHCYSNVAPLPAHVVTTTTLGSTVTKSRMGSGYLTVDLSASNTSCSVGFSTTDSFGGQCAWKGQ